MSKMQESPSSQEKEKLRKRLQKLFQQKERSEILVAGKSKRNKQPNKDEQSNRQGTKIHREQEVTANNLNKTIPKIVKKQVPKKSPKTTHHDLKQNGFLNKPTNHLPAKKNLTKPQGIVENKIKSITNKTKSQKKKADSVLKTTENTHTKVFPTKPQARAINKEAIDSQKSRIVEKKVKKNVQQNRNLEPVVVKKKNKQTFKNTSAKNQQQTNVPKTGKTSKIEPNINPSRTKIDKNLEKNSKKRAASEDTWNNEISGTNKKLKLTNKYKTKENIQKIKQAIEENKANSSDSSSSQFEEDFDVAGMTGCVRGGDYDSDNEDDAIEHNYLMHEENYSSDNDNVNEYNSDHKHLENKMHNFKKQPERQLEQYKLNESSAGEDEYSDSDDKDDFNHYYEDSEEEEEEEEDENYSDFDEDDFEEDVDSYNYSSDNEDDYSSNYDDDDMSYDDDLSYDFNYDIDHEYHLPEHIPEDLIIHKGTAIKRDLKPEDNVTFDSENKESQIVELIEQNSVKVINQPKAYEKDELLKLKYDEKTLNTITFHRNEQISPVTTNDIEDCPNLVPIVDRDGFQLYKPNEASEDEVQEAELEEELENEEQTFETDSMEEYENDYMDNVSLGSEYIEINSDDSGSWLSENINEKYLNRDHDDSNSDSSIDENMWNQKHKADIIDATQYKYESKNDNDKDKDPSDISLNDDIEQIPSFKLFQNVDLKTGSSILSTTIIDNKVFKSNDDTDNEICYKPNEKPETENKPQQEEAMAKSVAQDDVIMEVTKDKSAELVKVMKPTGQSLANYNTKFFNAFDSNLVIVLLKDPFYIYGTVRLILLAGTVEVYGHALSLNTEVEIFSPRGCSVIEITSLCEKNNLSKQLLEETLKTYEKHFALADLKTICDLYNSEKDAVVLLKRNETRKKVVQQFKKFMNENVFPNINNINVDRPLYNSEYLLRCMINTSAQEQKCLRLPKQWQQLSLTTKSRVMLTGGKSVGKSTLLRYLINRHLPQKILLIDLDIGQPEVFMPQTVSCTVVNQPLLGPGFMLNLQPEISYVVGHTNIALCAHKYMAAVCSLLDQCKAREEYNDLPWLINTMGYNKGFGLELISVIAQELPLTDVIQLQSNKDINNFDSILHPHVLSDVPRIMFPEKSSEDKESSSKQNYSLHVWQSAVQQESRYQKEWEMSAKDLRFAMLLARLSGALQAHAEWLTDIKPLSAPLKELKIINLLDNTPLASAEDLAKSLEANLVYLCRHQQDDEPLKCLGIGVVRAIDFHVQQLYLIPAIPYTQLKEVNCLATGEMPLPTSLFTNQGSRVKNTAPFVYNTVSANASKAIKQIYHRPRKFLTGQHKSLD